MSDNIYAIMMMTVPEIYSKYIAVNKKVETRIYVKALNVIYVNHEGSTFLYNKFVGVIQK